VLFRIQSILNSAISVWTNCKTEGQLLRIACADESLCSRFKSSNALTINRFIVTFILFYLWSNPILAEKAAHILVVTSSNDAPYQEAITGFKAQFSSQGKIQFTELALAEAKSTPKKIASIKPDLIYTLGSEAAQWASLEAPRIPIVATMVLKDDIFNKSANITGISLGYSLKTQFEWLKKFFPQQKAVAILFNPAENAATVQTARAISQQEGFKLVAIPVASPKELPYALEQLSSNIEILFAIPDETVMSVNTAKEVLLASFRNKVPLVGLSDNWVKSGAFYAMSWDYKDIGQQCAGMAQKLLAGVAVKALPPEHPRKITYTINAKIAEHMDMQIPDELLRNAKIVFN
jgi:putative tryptophan/tyrosine transport system substrate-binding protein